jgi:predicted chitinase
LATAYHETTFSFKARREAGKGKGYKYGKEIEVVDTKGVRGKAGNKYKNVYYGRGYVQLTWDYNYKILGKAIGMGDKLYIDPDLALKADTAYKITSYGMRNGSFTGKKLSDYIGIAKTDYKNARRIINGTDNHIKIAEYAESMEVILRLAAKPITGLKLVKAQSGTK